MEFRVESLGVAGSVTQVFAELIHDRLGLVYDASRHEQLADRLAPLVVARGFGSFMDYYYVLKYSEDPLEWQRVMDALAVPETYFWREVDQVRAIVEHVLPALVDAARGETLRIWSVPCSTGEEPLTLAMLVDERGWFDRAPIEIVASDASPAAIVKARAGLYGSRAFRILPPGYRDRYFQPQPDGRHWMVSPALRDRVQYDVVNLQDGLAVAAHARVPVIFCRNVFIYFSRAVIERVVDRFARAMPRPAFLCLGASESLLRVTSEFELREIGGAFVYVKGDAVPAAPPLTLAAAERAS